MARPTWTGSISFGLVNVPVKAYTAVRDHDVHFNQLEKKSGARIRNRKVSEKTGKEVDRDDIAMGFEVRKGRYVTFEKGELDELRPESTKAIEVTDFVDLGAVDPIYYERTYWLGPADDAGKAAYQLLLAAMEDKQKVAIGTVVMRNKQYLAAIRPLDGALAVSTMRFHDEVMSPADIDAIPTGRSAPRAQPAEVKMAGQIIDSMSRDWDPKRYEDTYRVQVLDYLKKKAAGEEIEVVEEPEEQSKVVDLMAALEASLDAAKKSGSRRTSSSSSSSRKSSSAAKRSSSSAKKTPAKKAPAKKSASTSRRSSSGSKRKSA